MTGRFPPPESRRYASRQARPVGFGDGEGFGVFLVPHVQIRKAGFEGFAFDVIKRDLGDEVRHRFLLLLVKISRAQGARFEGGHGDTFGGFIGRP
jgi:hypothetical protein